METRKNLRKTLPCQNGFTIMEVMLSITLSLVVTGAMVALMASSLGSTSRIVNMTKLTDDMRMTMQMLSRDVRRSSYNANALYCYGNDDCGTDGSAILAPDITISDSGNCFTFLIDRDHDGDSTENDAGGFRRIVQNGVGVMQMWIGNSTPDCGSTDVNWVQVTNADIMDIANFTVDDSLSYTDLVFDDGSNQIYQKIRRVRINMEARLVADNSISRRVQDVISVRNDLLF